MVSVPERIRQAAAIPVHAGQICVITSSSGNRWVIPKGCLEPGKTLAEIALQEAWEEAGLIGRLQSDAVGSYTYEKWDSLCDVTVFLMEVTAVADAWPECTSRERRWLGVDKAITRISDRGLRRLLRKVQAGESQMMRV